MKRAAVILSVLTLLIVAGCKSTGPRKNLGHEGGEAYADVVVPENYVEYDTPPFKRQDGASGKRLYGRYAYRSTDGLDSASEVQEWLKAELPKQGWELQTEELDDAKGTMSVRFEKDEDILLLELAPDDRVQGTERFSILTVEMNPQYD
jgi:hypothetical protein